VRRRNAPDCFRHRVVYSEAVISAGDALRSVLGASKVSTAAADVAAHSADKWFASHPPDVVVFAECAEDVVQTLDFARAHRIPVTTRGAGVGYVGGCVPLHGGIALSMMRMNRIHEINTADGVAVVEPGVITGDLQAAVRESGWFYPPDPASLKECSIGGNIATNAGGPRCLKYGVTRNYVLGLEVVLADGTRVRAGGRCHKNKTGFDLVGLFVGSEGLLGVVTEATLRLIPHPPARAVLSASFRDFASAVAAVQRVFDEGFLPAAVEISDRFTLESARRRLGADALPAGDALLLVEFDGHDASVRHESNLAGLLLGNSGALAVRTAPDEAACERMWAQRREFSYGLRDTGLTKLNEDVVVPRGRLVDLARFCSSLQADTGIPIACFGHAGDGNLHVNLMVADFDDPAVRAKADAALDRLFAFIIGLGGAITGEHGIGLAKNRWFADAVGPGAFDVHRRLKAALDPDGILNPGKFVDVG
jgi:glycolate oxidase